MSNSFPPGNIHTFFVVFFFVWYFFVYEKDNIKGKDSSLRLKK